MFRKTAAALHRQVWGTKTHRREEPQQDARQGDESEEQRKFIPRHQHLELSRARAMAFLDAGNPGQAVYSMTTDLMKHPQFDSEAIKYFGYIQMIHVGAHDVNNARKWIESIR